ncbi:histidine phosphatase, putative [Bodo saltans]|uniref:Histidine phosphatase, putative n=1 Tax=Bodo saltans TaxID=75058 RepID=A0A0S4JP96_BODSA|nr:histidine phosphatase, putative [Bodo saltans]|eukprot:CUG92044.1 histidine phosphatase, putative [Bodo saltans]
MLCNLTNSPDQHAVGPTTTTTQSPTHDDDNSSPHFCVDASQDGPCLGCTITTEGDAALTSSLVSETAVSRSSSTGSSLSTTADEVVPSCVDDRTTAECPNSRAGGAAAAGICARRRRILLVRHGESETNVCGASVHVFDPSLTAKGQQQAIQAGRLWTARRPPHATSCEAVPNSTFVVLTSPLTRALQTAHFAFLHPTSSSSGAAVDKIVAVEDLREVVGKERIAELRRPCHILSTQYPAVDFSHLLAVSNEDPMAHLAVDLVNRCAGPGERRNALEARARRVWDVLCSPDPTKCSSRTVDALPPASRWEEPSIASSSSTVGTSAGDTVAVVSHYNLLTFLCRHFFDQAFTNSRSDPAVLNALSCLESNGALEDWPNGGALTVDCVFYYPVGPDSSETGGLVSKPSRWSVVHAETSF